MLRVRMSGSVIAAVLMGVSLFSGCGSSVSYYAKPEAPWGTIQRVAVLPFTTPSENPTRRQLITQLFTEELRRVGVTDIVEVPLTGAVSGSTVNLQEVAQAYEADAVFTGSVDDSHGTVVHIRLHDPATEEILWSGTYLLGVGPEFFSLRTQQQQFSRSVTRMVNQFSQDVVSSQ